MRNQTRRQRYNEKLVNSSRLPVSLATINFQHDVNVAYVIRSAVCFGAESVMVIGSMPQRQILNALSGTMADYIDILTFSTPHQFLEHIRRERIKLLAAEICDGAESLFNYSFNFSEKSCIIVGGETTGITADILQHSECIYVPMPGVGYCLNTSQAANIMIYEYAKQFNERGC